MTTIESIFQTIERISLHDPTRTEFIKRLEKGLPTRDENSISHFCVYFLPFDKATGRVFIVHHKKSGLWISPGGHIDKNETITKALNREIHEELGVVNFFKTEQQPFLLTITSIDRKQHTCKQHFDAWFLVPTSDNDLRVNMEEFHDSRWMTLDEARQVITDSANLKAIETLKSIL